MVEDWGSRTTAKKGIRVLMTLALFLVPALAIQQDDPLYRVADGVAEIFQIVVSIYRIFYVIIEVLALSFVLLILIPLVFKWAIWGVRTVLNPGGRNK